MLPLPDCDFSTQLAAQLRQHGSRPALIDPDGESLNYADLGAAIAQWRGALAATGCQPGDRVVVWANKRSNTAVVLLAIWAMGLVAVPLHPALRPAQVRRLLERAGAQRLITDAVHSQLLGLPHPEPDALYISHAPFTESAPPRWDAPLPPDPTYAAQDLAALLFTSGSTGEPKGVMVTRANLAAGAAAVSGYLGLQPDDRVAAVLPLSFDYGLSQLTTALWVGAAVVLVDYLLSNDLKAPLLHGGITTLAGTPGLLIPLARQHWLAEAGALRRITNSGGSLPVATVRALRAARPQTQVFLMYGLTEAFRASFLPPDQTDAFPNSIGAAFSASVLGLVDDCGRLLTEPVAEGELVQGGALVTAGYWQDPAATALRFRPPPAGWPNPLDERVVFSGDRVRRDAAGRLYFVGRLDEQIKVQGIRISPEEIEAAAARHPAVIEALAFGYTEGENARIALVVAPESVPSDTLRRFLQAELAPFQWPHRIETWPNLPRSANGKLDRGAARGRLFPPQNESKNP
ncbi:AMP-binding protein [Halothiobacillus sp. DCM-1]|uniref:AMP-binding protein n=1 Tax=Halothiobacillus sp. DCM-1 TaxID=3112558 RepID=UPI003243635A